MTTLVQKPYADAFKKAKKVTVKRYTDELEKIERKAHKTPAEVRRAAALRFVSRKKTAA